MHIAWKKSYTGDFRRRAGSKYGMVSFSNLLAISGVSIISNSS
jgi:hypothetical protein